MTRPIEDEIEFHNLNVEIATHTILINQIQEKLLIILEVLAEKGYINKDD